MENGRLAHSWIFAFLSWVFTWLAWAASHMAMIAGILAAAASLYSILASRESIRYWRAKRKKVEDWTGGKTQNADDAAEEDTDL